MDKPKVKRQSGGVQGEGNYEAAREYIERTRRFVRAGRRGRRGHRWHPELRHADAGSQCSGLRLLLKGAYQRPCCKPGSLARGSEHLAEGKKAMDHAVVAAILDVDARRAEVLDIGNAVVEQWIEAGRDDECGGQTGEIVP